MFVQKDRENVLKILRFLAENEFSEEVANILLSEMNRSAIGSALSARHKKDRIKNRFVLSLRLF
ncbi:MAG: hypothetical protein LBI47_01725 [Puniceicoccales bacterium]|jgi:hypothetical protein|nr:hypothetical protein [Puniceicoccales bacterium]